MGNLELVMGGFKSVLTNLSHLMTGSVFFIGLDLISLDSSYSIENLKG